MVCAKILRENSEEVEKEFKDECTIFQQGIHHDNILALLNAGKSKVLKNGEPVDDELHFYFVSELASKGELFTYVYDR